MAVISDQIEIMENAATKSSREDDGIDVVDTTRDMGARYTSQCRGVKGTTSRCLLKETVWNAPQPPIVVE